MISHTIIAANVPIAPSTIAPIYLADIPLKTQEIIRFIANRTAVIAIAIKPHTAMYNNNVIITTVSPPFVKIKKSVTKATHFENSLFIIFQSDVFFD